MRILHITSSFLPIIGGQEKVVEELAEDLQKLKHDITILTTDLFCENSNLPKHENLRGIEIVRCKNDLFLGGYGYSREAISWLKENWRKYDVVHCHGYNRFLSEFAVYYLRKKKPVIFTPHGFIHTKRNYLFKKVHDLTLGKFVKYAKICTALTKLDFKEYKKLGVKKEKIVEIPNGVSKDFFKKINKQELKNFKTKYKIKENAILYVGRIHESKGLQYVFEAIKDLNLQFILVGQDSGYKKSLVKLAEKLKIENKINFIGNLNKKDLVKIYRSCKAFVLFSEWEGFGIVVVEAMASEKPVIISDRGSLVHLVDNNQEGFIVPFQNTTILKKKIEELLEDNKKIKIMGTKGKKTAKNYMWEKITKDYEKIYKKIK